MKLFLYLFVVFVPFTCIAQTMCVRDNTLVISLDSGIKPEHHAYNTSEFIWWNNMSYGTIYGEATCLSANEGLGRTSERGKYYGVDEYGNTPIVAEPALSGVDANGNERLYCWCRLMHPAYSYWAFENIKTSASTCASRCANDCAYSVRIDSALRVGLFKSVGL